MHTGQRVLFKFDYLLFGPRPAFVSACGRRRRMHTEYYKRNKKTKKKTVEKERKETLTYTFLARGDWNRSNFLCGVLDGSFTFRWLIKVGRRKVSRFTSPLRLHAHQPFYYSFLQSPPGCPFRFVFFPSSNSYGLTCTERNPEHL